MSGNRIIKNYLYNLLYQIVTVLLPIITLPYISRVLGAEGVGAYAYTYSITFYFMLFGCFGLNLYGQKATATANTDQDRYAVFWEIFFLRTLFMLISLLVFYFFVVRNNIYTNLFQIQALYLVGTIFDIGWFFQGLEKFKETAIRNISTKLLGTVLVFLFVKREEDLWIYVLILSGVMLAGNLLLWAYLPKYLLKVRNGDFNLIRHIKPSLLLFLPQIATSIYTVLNKTMLGLITNSTSEVAYYDLAERIVKIAVIVVSSISTVMMPRIAKLFVLNDRECITSYMKQSFNFVFAIGFPIMFGIIAIAHDFVPWFLGNGYRPVVNNLITLVPIVVIIGLSSVLGSQYLVAINRQKQFTIAVFIGAIFNFLANLVLIRFFNSFGAILASVLAEIVILAVMFYFVKDTFRLSVLIKESKNYLVASIIMGIVVGVVGIFLTSSFFSIVIEIILGMSLYIITLFILKDPVIKIVIEKGYYYIKSLELHKNVFK